MYSRLVDIANILVLHEQYADTENRSVICDHNKNNVNARTEKKERNSKDYVWLWIK